MKTCKECSKPLIGRSDKKFCDDGCRNSFNNRHNSETNKVVNLVNSILKKNRTILQNLIPEEGKVSISEKTLMILGFNFDYYTNIYRTKKGGIYKFCYEYGYLQIDEGVLMLVKKQAKH
ncbi:MAG: hypothetical protein R2852_01230 [Bacteroidia bacterium]